jgi:hypothetical protein
MVDQRFKVGAGRLAGECPSVPSRYDRVQVNWTKGRCL